MSSNALRVAKGNEKVKKMLPFTDGAESAKALELYLLRKCFDHAAQAVLALFQKFKLWEHLHEAQSTLKKSSGISTAGLIVRRQLLEYPGREPRRSVQLE